MSELGEVTQPIAAEVPLRPSGRNKLLRAAFSGGVAVLAALTLAGSSSAPRHDSDAIRSVTPITQKLPEDMTLDLVDSIPGITTDIRESKARASKMSPPIRVLYGFDPAQLRIPKTIASIMRRNALYMPIPGVGDCSASAIRNKRNQVIGMMTAEHCGLNQTDANSEEGSDGQNYIVQPKPWMVYSGENLERLATVAKIDQYIVPNTRHTTSQDLVLGVAKGHTREQVLNAYEQSALSAKEIQKLKPGTTMYMAGYPTYQPVNWTDNEQRQMFAMTIIRTATVKILGDPGEPDKILKVVQAAVPTDEQGAVCSYGASGSRGFVMVDGQVRTVGVLSGFMSVDNNVPAQSAENIGISKYLPADRSSTPTAVCSFAYQLGTVSRNDTVVDAVRSADDIPGNSELNELTDYTAIAKKLEDPRHTKTFLNGIIGVQEGDKTKWISNPVLFYDAKDNLTTFAFSKGNNGKKHESTSDVTYFIYSWEQDLKNVYVYPHQGSDVVSLDSVTASLHYKADKSGRTDGAFVDDDKQRFGTVLKHAPKITGSVLELEMTGGRLGIAPNTFPLSG
jgi:hypothetical protein